MNRTARQVAFLAVVGTLVSTVVAHADFRARNRMIAVANPTRAGVFEVFQRATAGASDYWCTAGEYVRYSVGKTNTTRIYVVRGLGPSDARPGRTSVMFSYVPYDDVLPPEGSQQGYSVSVDKKGYNLSAGHGTAFCQQSVRRFQKRGLF